MYTLRCSAFITCVVIALFGTNAFHIHAVLLVCSGQVLGLSLLALQFEDRLYGVTVPL